MALKHKVGKITITAEQAKVPKRFHGMEFNSLCWPNVGLTEAVHRSRCQGGVLQSLAEVAALRIEQDNVGSDVCFNSQITRTAAIYFLAQPNMPLEHYHWYVAVCDSASAKENYLLAHPMEADTRYMQDSPWRIPQSHDLVQKMIRNALAEDRVFGLPHQDAKNPQHIYEVELEMLPTHPFAKAFYGDVAGPYATFLKNAGFSTARFWLPDFKREISDYVAPHPTVFMTPARLGGSYGGKGPSQGTLLDTVTARESIASEARAVYPVNWWKENRNYELAYDV